MTPVLVSSLSEIISAVLGIDYSQCYIELRGKIIAPVWRVAKEDNVLSYVYGAVEEATAGSDGRVSTENNAPLERIVFASIQYSPSLSQQHADLERQF